MAIDKKRLLNVIDNKDLTQEVLADMLGMSRSTFYRKMQREGESFSVKEIQDMVEKIPLTTEEAISIFFPKKVAFTQLVTVEEAEKQKT